MIERGNPVVFFYVSLEDQEAVVGSIKMELFAQNCPKTAENYRQFCTGEFLRFEQPTGYKNCTFHRVIKGFVLQGGDFVNHDGTGKLSIYGPSFPDETLTTHKHSGPGLLSMANSGPDTNGCQFFITCAAAPHLGKLRKLELEWCMTRGLPLLLGSATHAFRPLKSSYDYKLSILEETDAIYYILAHFCGLFVEVIACGRGIHYSHVSLKSSMEHCARDRIWKRD